LLGHQAASSHAVHPSSAETAANLRHFADQLDALLNIFMSSQAVQEPGSRGVREAAALTNLLGHPATEAAAAWLDRETALGNEPARRIAALFELVVKHAHEVLESDNTAAKPSLILLPPRNTQSEVSQLVAFATVVVQLLRSLAEEQERTDAANLAAEADGECQQRTPQLAEGTIMNSRIWLRGQFYRLTLGLRGLLSYLLLNPGVSEEQVIKHCAMSDPSHLHKRLKDLRDKLAVELKKCGWRLKIKTKDTHIHCQWEKRCKRLPTPYRR
jgi:hypothetical protein